MKKRVLCLMLALLTLAFCFVIPGRLNAVSAAEEFTGLSFYATATEGDTDLVKWQNISGKYYLFLPACTDISNLVLQFGGSGVTLDGVEIQSGEKTGVFADLKEHTLAVGADTYTVVAMQSANLPAVFITTKSGSMDHVNASKDNKESGYTLIVDDQGNVEYDGELDQIKGRGNSTWTCPKKPYNLKLESKADLFGLGKSKKWSLLANYFDQSLIRNSIMYDFAEEVGVLSQDCTLVDVYFNGEYNGTYLLTEKVDVEKTKVDIENLADANEEANPDIEVEDCALAGDRSLVPGARKWVDIPNNPEDITGGYILEFDFLERYDAEVSGFITTRGQCVVVKEPEYATEAQVNYIADYFQAFEDALYSDTGYNSLGKHYSEYCDIESIARQYLLHELALSPDASISSFFFYKDSDLSGDAMMYCDPAWDFDGSLANFSDNRYGCDSSNPSVWLVRNSKIWINQELPSYLAQAYTKEDIFEKILLLWNRDFMPMLEVVMSDDPTATSENGKLRSILGYAQEVSVSAQMNFVKWDTLGKILRYGAPYTGADIQENIEYVQNFFAVRVPMMDAEFGRESICEHTYEEVLTTEATCTAPGEKTFTCSQCQDSYTEAVAQLEHTYEEVLTTEATCAAPGEKTFTCSQCQDSYTEAVAQLEHTWQGATCTAPKTCTVCSATGGIPKGHRWDKSAVTKLPTTAEPGIRTFTCSTCNVTRTEEVAKLVPTVTGANRLAGNDRYQTAFKAADMLKEQLCVTKFDAVVVASGTEFADALSGSYLAAVKNAPMLLVRDKEATLAQVKAYILKNLNVGGTVYILGGEKAVPKAMETGFEGFQVKRLGGANRYETNLLVLKEAGVGDRDILICTGKDFADSLSASATEKPILLVKDSLLDSQKKFLEDTTGKKYIIGGTSAVNERIESALKAYGEVARLGGATRYETSVLVAQTFFADPDAMIVAYAQNFPDGLSGGSLAAGMDVPLILTDDAHADVAVKYAAGMEIKDGFVLGGPTLIGDDAVKKIFSTTTVK